MISTHNTICVETQPDSDALARPPRPSDSGNIAALEDAVVIGAVDDEIDSAIRPPAGFGNRRRDSESDLSTSATDSSLSPPIASLLAALSAALDLTEGQPMGHAVRTCLIALRIADQLGLPPGQRANLHVAALLKDSGCSSNSARMFAIFGCDDVEAKSDAKVQDWCRLSEAFRFAVDHSVPHLSPIARIKKLCEILRLPGRVMDVLTEARCTRGAEITRSLGLRDESADAIYSLDEHWDGSGAPNHVSGAEIPILSRILCLAQTLEVFATTFGVERAFDVARERSASWFDPKVVAAVQPLRADARFWAALRNDPQSELAQESLNILQDCRLSIDAVCLAFAGIVDAKSPFTGAHSSRVATVSVQIGSRMGLNWRRCRRLYRAGLLHDLGKLAIPNMILDKPGFLTDRERDVIKLHPFYTDAILKTIPGFGILSDIASAHHERLDGSGYHLGKSASDLSLDMRILAVADVYDALSSDRPYRQTLEPDTVARILGEEAEKKLDPDCVSALKI